MYKTVTLRDVADYSEDKIAIDEVSLENYITTDNILQNKQGITIAVNLPPQEGNLTKYEKGDILIANIRPYLKKIWFADREGGASADVLVIKVKKEFDPRFVYYALFRDDFFEHVMNGSKGTKMPRGDKNQIMDFLIPDFPKSEQELIASKLAVLDKKIELNNQINETLEQMAKMLYDYWFVQFDFPFDFAQGKPDAHGKPYKSSGGKMVYNEELKREIPEGWEVKELSEVIIRSGTGLNPRDNFKLGSGNNYYITIKSIKNGKIIFDDKCDKIDDEALKIINKRSQLQAGDILFTSIEPVGVTYLLHEKPTNWDINESVFTIRANTERVTPEYLYMLLSSIEMQAFTKNVSAGSIHKGIRHSVLKTFKFAYSDKSVISIFTSMILPMLKRINNIDKENQKLTQLRDWLLPMLMNGQVTVTDAAQMVEELMAAEPKQGYGVK